MKLIDVFQQLAGSEFAQLKLGDTGAILEKDWPRITTQVNLGLMALYKRFPLKQGTLTLALQANQNRYLLTSRYAVSNIRSTEPVKYLLDTGAPFVDDILKVEEVSTTAGDVMALNQLDDPYTARTPAMTTLEIPVEMVNGSTHLPDWLKTSFLTLRYRASHPLLATDADPERATVELPLSHLEALLYFVASRVVPTPVSANEINVAAGLTAKYEAECLRLEQQNLAIDQGRGADRLHRNGWV